MATQKKKVAPSAATNKKGKYVPGQYVYAFKDGHGLGKPLLGGKGAGLAEMTSIGIKIPDGFTISNARYDGYYFKFRFK